MAEKVLLGRVIRIEHETLFGGDGDPLSVLNGLLEMRPSLPLSRDGKNNKRTYPKWLRDTNAFGWEGEREPLLAPYPNLGFHNIQIPLTRAKP